MSLCTCPERPRCEYNHCGNFAEWSLLTPPGRWIKTFLCGRLHFMCTNCADVYREAISKPLKGIDRPEHADEDWRPSIMEHLRHAEIAIAFEKRNERVPVESGLRRPCDSERFTPAQQKQIEFVRKYWREQRSNA